VTHETPAQNIHSTERNMTLKNRISVLAIVALAIQLAPGTLRGDLVTVANPGFEATALGEGASTSTVANWFTFGTPVTVMNPSASQFPAGAAAEGMNVAMLAPSSLLVQNLSSVLQYGSYTVEFNVGNRLDAGYAGLLFVFKAGGVGLLPFSSSAPVPGDGMYDTATFNFQVTPENVNGGFVGGALRIEILTPSSGSGFTAVDHVRINFSSSIPEPVAMPAFAIVAPLIALRRNRKISTKG
jgi:hypothetical protein